MLTQARLVIGEDTQFYMKPNKKFLPANLWIRFAYINNGINNLNKMVRAIEGRSVTVVIANYYSNAGTIATALARYASTVKEAQPIATLWYNGNIATAGYNKVSIFTRDSRTGRLT